MGLDGLRGFAAVFVLVHHCWLMAFPGYPEMNGPAWAGWMIYGHFAVALFIVISGFSLASSPARNAWKIGSLKRFAKRRAWRILPPYWAALAASMFISWFVVLNPGKPRPNAKSVLVHGLLLQDIFGSPSPNGAFWSIAIEAQLYIVFPFLVLMVRRTSPIAMLVFVCSLAVAVAVAGSYVPFIHLFMRFAPQLGALFAFGIAAAAIVNSGPRIRSVQWHWVALFTAIPIITLVAKAGSVWTVRNFFWVDLAFGPAMCALLAALALGRPKLLIRVLDAPASRNLGSYSYSLYLVHFPVVMIVFLNVVNTRYSPGVPQLLALFSFAVPLAIVVSRAFASVFEFPFTRNRSWREVRAEIAENLGRLRRRTTGAAPEGR